MDAIIIKNLKKHFRVVSRGRTITTKAVDGVSFSVKKGETFGFLGPNGAGKTTTIRCLMDFIRPTEGEVTILGLDAKKDSVALKKKIGYLPGNVRLQSNWTGWDHIRFVESIRGKSEKSTEIAQKLDLDLSKKFKSLSSGNRQKLGLVLALMHEPEILIMDEPTVGLDPLLQNTIYVLLEDLKKKGTTIFISSHNLPEVERVCDRVGIIKEGKMIEVETLGGLEGKRMHRIEVHIAGKYSPKDFSLDGVDKVEEITSGHLILTVGGGDLNPIINKLSTHKITDIEISHASLEEIFLKFYEKKGRK